MKKYYVVESRKGDEWALDKTESLADAIKSARGEWGNLTKKERENTTVEIRQYEADIEDEECDNYDYDSLEWGFVIRDKEAGNALETVKTVEEAEDVLWRFIQQDKEEDPNKGEEELLSFYEVIDPADPYIPLSIEWNQANEEIWVIR